MRRLIVISGAGFSAESGVRTFRTDTDSGKALWDEYDLEEVCNIHAFRGNFYHKTHMFYNKRRAELPTVHPNAAHLRVAEWYKRYPGQVVNMTTNVDDLLERAGVHKEDTLYIHGYLKEILIKDAFTKKIKVVDIGYDQIDPDDYDWCKPNVIFFGENAPAYGPMYDTLESLTNQDLVIVVGCSNTVINFNWELFPAVVRGTKVVVVNPAIKYDEQMIYENAGVLVYRTGAVDAFNNPGLIKMVENHLEGKTPLQSKEK
ncbi:NAD-dependent protein deacetylase [Raoultella phage Ro1]|uniref:NAD-dependent protein deacetylase n=1 Tax=Raoultella phage Ro1 TaxID=2053702 RepID=A0A2H4YGV5_9CAUD|nr:Sir2 (NAD-dependent deacetylase) [Raoultella phage Ro1]AUE23363.1 NAD-dependent protein deacetylase [Raoultella phage Ro1]